MVKYLNLKQKNRRANINEPSQNPEMMELLRKLGLEITIEYVGLESWKFDNDNRCSDKYKITFEKGRREYTFDFWNSIYDSGEFLWLNGREALRPTSKIGAGHLAEIENDPYTHSQNYKILRERYAPSIDSVLSHVNVFDGDFYEFCDCFDYNNDSIKAFDVYKEVKEQSNNFKMLFTEEELDEIQEVI